MRKSLVVTTIAIIGLVAAGSTVSAQMMSGNHMMNHDEATAETPDTDMPHMMGMSGDGMSAKCELMASRLADMQTQFDQMLQVNDLPTLKRDMRQYQVAMQGYVQDMTQHQQMCKQMMAGMSAGDMMNSGGMKCGMMGDQKAATVSGS